MMAAKYPFSVDGNEFQGKRVLVTGGTKGMGEAIVRRLTIGGGSVATTARCPQFEYYVTACRQVQNGWQISFP